MLAGKYDYFTLEYRRIRLGTVYVYEVNTLGYPSVFSLYSRGPLGEDRIWLRDYNLGAVLAPILVPVRYLRRHEGWTRIGFTFNVHHN